MRASSLGSVRTRRRGQNSIVLLYPRRPAHVLPALPVHVHVEEKTSDLVGLPDIFLSWLRKALRRIMDIAGESVTDINITDVETTFDTPSVLTTWAEIAQEVTESHA